MPSSVLITLLVLLPALGAAGFFLAMPGGRRGIWRAGAVLLALAVGVFFTIAAAYLVGGVGGWFIALSLIGLFGAGRMITHKLPVYSALYFILVVVSATGLLITMDAEFMAAALLIIYAGAILVTYLFVIMLAQQSGAAHYDSQARDPLIGSVTGFLLLGVILARILLLDELAPNEVLLPPEGGPETPPVLVSTVRDVGMHLFTNYVVVVQAAGVLLLAAMVGAIAVARRKATTDAMEEAD